MTTHYRAPARRRVYLMRHGSVDYFDANNQPVADPSLVDLNDAGREQARAAGALFKAQNIRFDRVLTSSLPRTQQTARAVLQAMEHPELDLVSVDGLRELESGDMSNVPADQIEDAFLGPFRGLPQPEQRYLMGESMLDFSHRVLSSLFKVLQSDRSDSLLIVAHGGVNRVILGYALTQHTLMLSNLLQAPGCINVLDISAQPRDWIVRAVNLNPKNWLAPRSRVTTVEQMLEQFLQGAAGQR
jgi:probable phosphoglycerate mutase